MNDFRKPFDESIFDGTDPARRMLRELPTLRFPDDALESVFDATVRARTVAGKRWRSRGLALFIVAGTAAAAAAAWLIAPLVLGRPAPATPPSDARVASSAADAETIDRAELGLRLAFGVTERTLERFPVLNLLKTSFPSPSERKR